jgi:hypothetical protein
MASVEQIDREPSVLVSVPWLASLLVLYFALGHLPPVWEHWLVWRGGPAGAPVMLPACPYPQCATWIPW